MNSTRSTNSSKFPISSQILKKLTKFVKSIVSSRCKHSGLLVKVPLFYSIGFNCIWINVREQQWDLWNLWLMDIFTFTFVFYIFIWHLYFTFIFIYSSIIFWIESSCDSLVDYSELQTVGRCSLQINKRIQTWTQSLAKSTVLYQNENYLTSLSENFACLWRQGWWFYI